MITLKLRSKISVPRVLVIEDEVQLAELCRVILQNAGARVKVIYDAADAADAIESFRPDLIVSDIKMPEVRGDELLMQLRDAGLSIPVILITGLERSKVSLPRDTPNLFALLQKPFDYDQLIRTVQMSLNLVESQRVNELLLRQLHRDSASEENFEVWQESALSSIMLELNKRRAS